MFKSVNNDFKDVEIRRHVNRLDCENSPQRQSRGLIYWQEEQVSYESVFRICQ